MNIEPNLNFSEAKKEVIRGLFESIANCHNHNVSLFNDLEERLLNEINAHYILGTLFYKDSIKQVDFAEIRRIVGYTPQQ